MSSTQSSFLSFYCWVGMLPASLEYDDVINFLQSSSGKTPVIRKEKEIQQFLSTGQYTYRHYCKKDLSLCVSMSECLADQGRIPWKHILAWLEMQMSFYLFWLAYRSICLDSLKLNKQPYIWTSMGFNLFNTYLNTYNV